MTELTITQALLAVADMTWRDSAKLKVRADVLTGVRCWGENSSSLYYIASKVLAPSRCHTPASALST